MASSSSSTAPVCTPRSSRPPWVAETQRVSWGGQWEPTALPSDFSGWVRNLVSSSQDPLPFAASLERNGDLACDDGLIDPEALQQLVYPTGTQLSFYSVRVDEHTDFEGWSYASRGDRLSQRRLGGRAGRRFGDCYRQRWWEYKDEPQEALKPVSPTKSVPSQVAEEEKQKALQSFSQMFKTLFAGRGFHEVPLDPTSYMRRANSDAAWYESLCSRLPPWTDVGILSELCVASLYMRAAYGYVARTGMFDSAISGAMVFSVQKASFDIAEDVDAASHTHSFLDMMGLLPDDVVWARWKADGPFRPACIIVRDHAMRWIVVAVRGTLSMKDVFTDLAAHNVEFQDGQAHEGMLQATQQLLGEIKDVLCNEMESNEGYRLVFCGHSMGGAVANLAVTLLRTENDWAKDCVAYGVGTPSVISRCIGERLAQERAVFTVVNCRDWSPRFSATNVNELLDHLCELSVLRSAMRVATWKDMPQSRVLDPASEQLPAGVILQLAQPGDGGRGHRATGPVLLSASSVDYRHAMPVWPDFEAHIPIFYIRGLLEGLAHLLSSAPPRSPARGSKVSSDAEKPQGLVTLGNFLASALEEDGYVGERLSDNVLTALRRVASQGEANPGRPQLRRAVSRMWEGHPLPAEPDGGCELAAQFLSTLGLRS